MKTKSKYERWVKPFFDRAVALVLIILTSPLMGIIAAILSCYPGPVLFRHVRPGYLGNRFVLIKFRSMSSPNHNNFAFGKFLRKTSLDELPQLWNVLKGEMSFVGPRPLLEAYMEQYTEAEHMRHAVKPGVTGWAQVNGRNTLTLADKLKMDIWYVEHISLITDVRILFKTGVQLFKWGESDYHAINHPVL